MRETSNYRQEAMVVDVHHQGRDDLQACCQAQPNRPTRSVCTNKGMLPMPFLAMMLAERQCES